MVNSTKVATKNEIKLEHENEAQTDAASPTSSVELTENGYSCPGCSSIFTNSQDLLTHLRNHNSPSSTDCSGEDDYSCGVYNKHSLNSLDRHVLVHPCERVFKCKHCDMSFATNGNMDRHLRTIHRTASPNNSCTDSEGSSDSERPTTTGQDEYNNNEIAKSNSSEFIDCQQPSPSNNDNRKRSHDDVTDDIEHSKKRKALLNNCKSFAATVARDILNYQCSVCKREDFKTSAFLESHMETAHPKIRPKCESCNLHFDSHRMLNLHRFTKHLVDYSGRNRASRESVIGFNDLTFTDFSSEKFPTIARAICEQALHHPVSDETAKFQCSVCQLFFPCKSAQEAHEKECKEESDDSRIIRDSISREDHNNDGKTGEKSNDKSEELENASSDRGDDKSNDNQHTDNSETDRDVFFAVLDLKNKSKDSANESKETKDLADIESILNVTAEVLPNILRSDTSTPENNVRHNVSVASSGSSCTFSNEYNEEDMLYDFIAEFRAMKMRGQFPCRLCSAVYPNLRALKGHNRAHMNVGPGTPYPCNMCPYTSMDKATLVRHLRSHNGDRPYECSLCNYAFTTKANCERHVRNRHGKITREDVKSVLIYHPNEDSTNDNAETSSSRITKEDVKKSLVYPNEHEDIRSQHRYVIPPVEETKQNPGPSMVRETSMNRYNGPEIFPTLSQFQSRELVQNSSEGQNMLHNLVVKSNYSKMNDDGDSRSSDDSVSLHSVKSHAQDSLMNLQKTGMIPAMSNSVEEGPLDLSMDVLDLSKKTRETHNAITDSQNEQRSNNDQRLFNANQFFLTQALLKNNANTPVTPLEKFYAIYHNFDSFAGDPISSGLISSYLLNQGLVVKDRLQKEFTRGLQLTGGGTLVNPSNNNYANYSQANDIAPPQITSTEQHDYTNLISANKVVPTREKMDNVSSNNSVKMVIKNGILMPKQKQRRYRTERPFGCEHCSARFTLRSNMERHIKQQHPQYWSQRPRGGHSSRGRPPTSHPTLLQNLGHSNVQAAQSYANILPKTEPTEYNKHAISDEVKYAILAQQLKGSKMEENNSEEELIIDEEDKDSQKSESQHESVTTFLRDQLENSETIKDIESGKKRLKVSHENNTAQDKLNHTNSLEPTIVEGKLIKTEPTEQVKLEDGTPDLASVSKLLDNASQQYQQFQPQYLSDEEGVVASPSESNGSDEKSDSLNSLNSENVSAQNKKKKRKKKKSAYSMAPNRVICPYCERPFPWSSSLRRHILTHTGQKPYRCLQCSLFFTTKSNCDRHLSRKHKTDPNTVRQNRNSSSPDNQTVTNNNNNNNSFTMRNVPERPYKCNQCPSSTFSTLGNLKKHRTAKHSRKSKTSRPDTPPSDQQNSPPQCSKQTEQSDYESSSVSENMENSSCANEIVKSNRNTSSATNETNKSRRTSPRSSPSPGELPFKCHLCDNSFAERQDCLEHIKTKHKRSYEMLVAKGALDMDIDALEDQIAAQQHPSDGEEKRGRFPDYSNRKVVCAFCLRRFWSAEDLRRHMRTHTGERPFQCDICSRKFTLKHSMLRHRKKHESTDSPMYIGTSGDEEGSPVQPPTITPRSEQHPSVPINTSRPRTQDRISLPTVAAVATADAAPCALMRYNHYDNMATLSGRMANDGSQAAISSPAASLPPASSSAEVPSESGDNDLISNLLGIREKGLLDKVLLSTADDAAKLLGVNHNE